MKSISTVSHCHVTVTTDKKNGMWRYFVGGVVTNSLLVGNQWLTFDIGHFLYNKPMEFLR